MLIVFSSLCLLITNFLSYISISDNINVNQATKTKLVCYSENVLTETRLLSNMSTGTSLLQDEIKIYICF